MTRLIICFNFIALYYASQWGVCGQTRQAEREVNNIAAALSQRTQFPITNTSVALKYEAKHLSDLHFLSLAKNAKGLAQDESPYTNAPTEQLVKTLRAKEKAIYGSDLRMDYYAIGDPDVRRYADSVAALMSSTDIEDQGNGGSLIKTEIFGNAFKLCPEEAFYTQPIVAYGTCFLVSSNIVVTAKHCIRGPHVPSVRDIRIVFGYKMLSPTSANVNVSNNAVFHIVSILEESNDNSPSDFAILQLDKNVSGAIPLKLRNAGEPPDHSRVFVIGYPCGLPVKYAPGAFIVDNTQKCIFSANLDTFGGNSGSPVFNNEGVVEGILIRGETDFVSKDSNCWIARVLPSSGFAGEFCNRVVEVRHALAKHTH